MSTDNFDAIGFRNQPDSAVQRSAEALRALALERGDGQFIGSEEDLVTRFGVSRPTLRQAAALVEQEQLISRRRGVSGGYFAAQPTSSTVSAIAATYLRSRNAGLTDILRAVEPLRAGLARLACRQTDAALRSRLEQFLESERDADQQRTYRSFLRAERELGRVLGETAGNDVLSLFLSILYDLAALLQREEDIYINHPDRVERYRELRNRMVEAILERDEELAVILTRRCTRSATEWMEEDLRRRNANRKKRKAKSP